MPRKLRFVPEECLVEVTCRTIHGRFLLRPSKRVNELVLGVLGRAQRLTGMKICAFIYLSNHCHLLLRPVDAEQLASFMRHLNSNVAREVGRLHGWREKFWGRRYYDIIVSHEPEAQVVRLRYLLEQGVKEGLVAKPLHWPGPTSTASLAHGTALQGVWVDRTAQYRARLKGEPTRDDLFTSRESVLLSPLSCWQELDESQRQTLVRRLVKEIVSEHSSRRAGHPVLGRQKILEQNPRDRPSRSKRSPGPRFHAVDPGVRKALEWAYKLFRFAHRQAAEDLKAGAAYPRFPPGSFPGPGCFVPLRA
jgi:REP element-mobilizing transposase RayT